MFSTLRRSFRFAWGIAALPAVLLAPAVARADVIAFRNDTAVAVTVQITAVAQGISDRRAPFLLNPRATSPNLQMVGTKFITIYDPRVPSRVLNQTMIPATSGDLYLSIQPDVPPPAVKLKTVNP